MQNRTFLCTCVDCGTEFEAKCSNAKRCKPCASERLREQNRNRVRKHRQETQKEYRAPRKQTTMICACCGAETIKNSGNQKFCPTCSADAMYRRQIERKKRLEAEARGEIVVAHIGDTIKCVDCGAEMIKMNARHVRCENCREAHRLQHSRELWQQKKEANIAERRKKAAEPKVKTLSDIVAEARRLGLSYGQYTVLLENGTLKQYCQTHGIGTKGA